MPVRGDILAAGDMTPEGSVTDRIYYVSRSTASDPGDDLVARLVRGDQSAWNGFVQRYSRVIYGAIYKVLSARGRASDDDAVDVAQDVFVRICKDDFRLLKRYEPERSAITTWLTVVSTSVTKDYLRKKRAVNVPLDEMPAELVSVAPVMPEEKLQFPEGLLSPRQTLVLQMLFEQDLDVSEVAEILEIDPQTVRSTQHKALVKLRKIYGETRSE